MRCLRTILLALVVASASAASAETLRIGVFDPARIVAESKRGQALQDELNKFRIQREAEINKQRDDLKRLIDQYKDGVDTMSQERREEIEADLTQRKRDFERLARDAEADLQRKRQKGVRELEAAVADVLDGYAQEKGFTLILQRDLCAFAAPSIDISTDIVRLVDAADSP